MAQTRQTGRGRAWKAGLAALAVAATVLGLVGPGSPRAEAAGTSALSDRVGINTSYFWDDAATAQANLSQVAAGGVGWVRENFDWTQLEPSRGTFDWTDGDNLMTAASKTGLKVLGILDYSAPWASSDPTGGGDPKYPPSSPADYATYAGAVAARYGPGGTFWATHPGLSPDPLTALELWNEPWGYWDWKPEPDPAAYAALVEPTAKAIHAANAGVQVIMAGTLLTVTSTYGQVVPWLSALLKDDPALGHEVDGLSFHPYPDPNSQGPYSTDGDQTWRYDQVELVHQTEQAAGVNLPLWLTEVGWCVHDGDSSCVTAAQQAQYDSQAVSRATGEWGSFVARIFLYDWTGDDSGYDVKGTPAWTSLQALLAGAPAPTPSPVPGGPTTASFPGSPVVASQTSAPGGTYRLAETNGTVMGFGSGGGTSSPPATAVPFVGMASTPDGAGYWLVGRDGGVFSYGDAAFHGSTGAMRLAQPIVGMAATPDGGGYWLVAADGGIFSFGDARFFGSTGAIHLASPIVGMAATPDGGGYWLVGADGGVFSFGDANFLGSTGAMRLASPVVGVARTPDGAGYWLVAGDGGIFSFGDAGFHGSTGAIRLASPIVGMAPTPDGAGYWLVGRDGGVFSYGDAGYAGSGSGSTASPVVALTAG